MDSDTVLDCFIIISLVLFTINDRLQVKYNSAVKDLLLHHSKEIDLLRESLKEPGSAGGCDE